MKFQPRPQASESPVEHESWKPILERPSMTTLFRSPNTAPTNYPTISAACPDCTLRPEYGRLGSRLDPRVSRLPVHLVRYHAGENA